MSTPDGQQKQDLEEDHKTRIRIDESDGRIPINRSEVGSETVFDESLLDESEVGSSAELMSRKVKPPSDPLVGSILHEKYRIIDLIGSGGMGKVYLAEDRLLRRKVAMKLLSNQNLEEAAVMRFQKEGCIAANLRHNHIIAVHELGVTQDGMPFMAFEYLHGKSLAELINAADPPLQEQSPMDIHRFVTLFKQITSAMEFAHNQGVIHRDLKPSNIMITRDSDGNDIAKVVDFGIAKAMLEGVDQRTLTETGAIIGSLHYMSPEQCNGAATDRRSDIYSLGCVMYEVLTGRKPFDDKTPLNIMARQMYTPPNPMQLNQCKSEVAVKIEAIVVKALAKNPDDRFQSMSEILTELDSIATIHEMTWLDKLASRVLLSRARSATTPTEVKKRRQIIAGVVTALSLACIAAGVYVHKEFEQKDAERAAQEKLHERVLSADEKCELHLNRARDLMNKGELNRSESEIAIAERESTNSTYPIRDQMKVLESRRDLAEMRHDTKQLESICTTIRQLKLRTSTRGSIDENNAKIATLTGRLSADPQSIPTRKALVSTMFDQGQLYIEHRQFTMARNLIRATLPQVEQLFGRKSSEWATACTTIARSYLLDGNIGEAEPLYTEALKVRSELQPPDRLEEARAYSNIADFYFAANRLADAEAAYSRAIQLFHAQVPGGSLNEAESLRQLGMTLDAQHRWTEGEVYLKKSEKILEWIGQANGAVRGTIQLELARNYLSTGHHLQCRAELARMSKNLKGTDIEEIGTGTAHHYLGQLAWMDHDKETAAKEWQQAVKLFATSDPSRPEMTQAYDNLYGYYYRSGQFSKLQELMAIYTPPRYASKGSVGK